MFAPLIDIQQGTLIVQHTQSVSVPIRHPSDKSSVRIVTSFETYASTSYKHRKYNEIPDTYAVYYSCVGRLWVVFLEHGGGCLDISSRQFALTIKHGAFVFRFTLFFLPGHA